MDYSHKYLSGRGKRKEQMELIGEGIKFVIGFVTLYIVCLFLAVI